MPRNEKMIGRREKRLALRGAVLDELLFSIAAINRQGAHEVSEGELDARNFLRALSVSRSQFRQILMEQARRIHDRLAGVPPTEQVLLDMTDDINGVGGRTEIDAAFRALDNPGFYNATLKNWVAPWTNRDMDVFVPLNDYTATVIGMVRDDVPFNTLLSANILYVGAGGLGLPAYSMTDNNHYEQMDAQGVDLQADLVQVAQTDVTDIPLPGVAGIFTTRAAAEAFFIAGTNRAMFRFTMLNHLCNDMEHVKDITRVPDRIRQDVSRSPGGDSRIFLNNCIGCHTGMDPLAGAFAYYDFDETTAAHHVYAGASAVEILQ